MTDIPPEIAVARDIAVALVTAGRCREDADLYSPAKNLLRLYLESAGMAGAVESQPVIATPITVQSAMTSAPPTLPPFPHPTTPQPRADAVWNPWAGQWLVRTA